MPRAMPSARLAAMSRQPLDRIFLRNSIPTVPSSYVNLYELKNKDSQIM